MRTSIISNNLAACFGRRARPGVRSRLRKIGKAAGVAVLAGGLTFMGDAAPSSAVDLITNGGFENNSGFNGNNTGFGWFNDSDPLVFDVYDHSSQVYYSGAAPADAGQWYFHTVGIGDATGVYQDMDLTAAVSTSVIDGGTAQFDITAFLAGYTPQNDHPRIEVSFADGAGTPIGGVASVLDGGVVNDGGTLVFDTPNTFRSFVDATQDPLAVNPIALWKEYGDVSGIPVGARTARVTILEDSISGNGNDDYVDNVSFDVTDSGVEQFLKIEVNKSSGTIRMVNGSPNALDINFYEIISDAGTLNGGWNSFADQMLDSLGPNPEDNWQEAGGADANLLSEAFVTFDGGSDFALSESQTLSNAYSAGESGAEDLVFQYGLTDGRLIRGIVSYVTGSGDFDLDGDVDGTDFLRWQRGQSPSPLSASDLSTWNSTYGSSASLSGVSAVPEPSTILVAGFGIAALAIQRRKQ